MMRRYYVLVLVGLLILYTSKISGYDTGHHADLTRNTLEIFGYNNYSRDVAAISNWMVDYFSYTFKVENIPQMNGLHFDNIYTLQNISNYFTILAYNTRNSIWNAVRANDTLTYLSIVGSTTHAVQDFYTHSTWVENHKSVCGCYRDETWFSTLAASNGSVYALVPEFQSLMTYSLKKEGCEEFKRNCIPGQTEHGDYCIGINKDSYVRPYFEASYGFAFAATVEWIYNIQRWTAQALGVALPDGITNQTSLASIVYSALRSGGVSFNSTGVRNANSSKLSDYTNVFLNQAKNYVPPTQGDIDDLAKDVEDSIVISYATQIPDFAGVDDGHWKGAGTGDYARLAGATAAFTLRKSIFKNQFSDKHFWESIVQPYPYDTNSTYSQKLISSGYCDVSEWFVPYILIPPVQTSFIKIKVRTMAFDVKDKINTPSPYALVNIGDQEFEEGAQHNTATFSPHWTAIKFLYSDVAIVSISYSLWNDKYPGSDDKYKICNDTADGDLHFDYVVAERMMVGTNGTKVNGTYDNFLNTFTTASGSGQVKLYATTQKYGGCVIDSFPDSFCWDEAYTQILLHPSCDYAAASSLTSLLVEVIRFFFAWVVESIV